MTNEEWLKLTRRAKNDGDYYILKHCVIAYMQFHGGRFSHLDEFSKEYDYGDILMWYKFDGTLDFWRRKVGLGI